jgi:hypothetical protein
MRVLPAERDIGRAGTVPNGHAAIFGSLDDTPVLPVLLMTRFVSFRWVFAVFGHD